jgi:hypothetical protein
MADAIVQLATDGTGKKVDTSEITVGANTVERQRINISDPTAAAGLAAVSNAQPGASDYGLTVRPAGDGNVVLNATAISSAATLWTADVSGYRSFQFQVTGTFSATVVIEASDDNTNWNSTYFFSSTTILATTQSVSISAAVANGHGPIRAKYLRVRCSAFTSNTSSAVTFVLRTINEYSEFINVAISGSPSVFSTPSPSVSQTGNTAFVKAAATTNGTIVKASAGNLLGGILVNNSTAVKFFKFYNSTTVTAGSGTPVAVLGIPANGGNVCLSDNGYANARFSIGICYTITGLVADADTTVVAANDVSGWLLYI